MSIAAAHPQGNSPGGDSYIIRRLPVLVKRRDDGTEVPICLMQPGQAMTPTLIARRRSHRLVTSNDIVALAGIAERAKVSKPTVTNWRKLDHFPKPIARISDRTSVWAWSDVEQWLLEQETKGD